MAISLKSQVIILAVVIASTVAVTRYYFPRIETQTIDVIKEVIRTDVHTITRVVEKPDGTKETIIDHTDKSVENKDEKHSDTKFASKNWQMSGSASLDYTELTRLEPVYGIQVQRRILGPFYLGALADTSKKIGVSVGMEF